MASFPYFNETGSVYVCIRESTENIMKLGSHSMLASLFRRFTDTNLYRSAEAVPLKLATKYPWIVNIRIFLQCTEKHLEIVYQCQYCVVDACVWLSFLADQ